MFAAKNAFLVAIASQDTTEALKTIELLQRPTLDFPILADVSDKVGNLYGVFGMPSNPAENEPANTLSDYPSIFIVGSDRKLIWQYIGTKDDDRPQLSQILSHLP
jgi:peroxiredoxin